MELIMCKHKIDVTSILFIVFILTLLFQTPYGYTATTQLAGSKLRSLPLPVYKKGTTFIYSNGSWETVITNSASEVTWRDHRGYVSSGSPDFTRRRADWQTKTRQGTRQFGPRKDLWIKKKTSLWPLKIGNAASYSEANTTRRKDEPEKSYEVNWSCEVIGTERVSVMAGDFDTWKIVCKRYSTPRNPTKARVREVKTWYYAPELGHYVLTANQYFTGKPSKRLELLAVQPPLDGLSPSARRRMDTAFQKAMEFKKSGQSVTWSLPGTSVSGEIKPTATFRLDDGRYFRRYVQVFNLPQGQQIYYGMAIRDAKGKWVIPRR
jgi:hypothetical protein